MEGRKRVNAALAAWYPRPTSAASATPKKAAVGFCFGGGNVLELARSGADVNAVVCLHGDLKTTMPAKPGDIKAAVFVLHGSKDPVAPKADRDALEAEMDGAGANWQMLDFGGRLHSFAEEETMMKGVAEYNAPRRASDLPDARRLHPGRLQQEALTLRLVCEPGARLFERRRTALYLRRFIGQFDANGHPMNRRELIAA